MTLEATPIHETRDAGQAASPPGDASIVAGRRAVRLARLFRLFRSFRLFGSFRSFRLARQAPVDAPSRSLFSRCLARLFGLEAFLREPTGQDGWRIRD